MWRILLGITCGFFGGGGVVAIYGILLGDAGLDPGLTGWLLAAPALTGSLLRIPTAARADAVGARKILLMLGWAGVVGLALTSLVSVFGMSPWWLFPIGALSGCGLATFSVGAAQLGWSSPPGRAGMMLGLYGGFANLGPSVALMGLPAIRPYVATGWIPAMWAGVSALSLLIYTALAAEPVREHKRELTQREGFFSGTDASTWWLALAYFACYGVFVALCGWLPWLWEQTGVGAERAMSFALLAPISRMPSGWLSDRIGGVRCTLLASALALGSGVMMATGGSWLWQLPLAVGLGAMMGAVFAIIPRFSPHHLGKVSGLVGGLGATGGFVLPPILGYFVSPDVPARGMFSVVILLGVTFVGALLFLKREREAMG